MADVFTKRKRSEVMARIRGRGNKDTELALARLFRRHGITGWRRHVEVRGEKVEVRRKAGRTSHLAGPRGQRSVMSRRRVATLHASRSAQRANPTKPFRVRPDFVFLQSRAAVFVDGCFWHGCPRHATKPKNNAAFWRKKLAGNKRRDTLVTRTLRKAGWRVVLLWECALQRAIKSSQRDALTQVPRLLFRIQRGLRLTSENAKGVSSLSPRLV